MNTSVPVTPQSPTFQLDDTELAELERRQKLLIPLAEAYRPSRAETLAAAIELGISPRTVRFLVKRYRDRNHDPLAFLPGKRGQPAGFSRLPPPVENLIQETIDRKFARAQRPSIKAIHRNIVALCRHRGLKPPSFNTVSNRIRQVNPVQLRRRRYGANSAHALQPIVGQQMAADYPLHVVQIDHTVVDVIVVDSLHRAEMGRPYLTLALDLYSRCIAGYVLTLEPPSAMTVGLTLAHIATPKAPLLTQHGIAGHWPLHGKPGVLHTDNAKEFRSRELRQGCTAHGIELRYRPPGRPWYGGAIERVFGTFMRRVHELPGTTFSNVQERGEYPSQAKACLTLRELEDWLLNLIIAYHAELHEGLGEPPLTRLQYGLSQYGPPQQPANLRTYLIDFLPSEQRRITREGFRLDNIAYYSPTLDHWIERREDYRDGFTIRRNPYSLRFVWMALPDGQGYLELPYRNAVNPDITLWEHRLAVRKLRQEGRQQVDEDLIMRTVLAQRETVRLASFKSRKARRQVARLEGPAVLPASPQPELAVKAVAPTVEDMVIPEFTDLDVEA